MNESQIQQRIKDLRNKQELLSAKEIAKNLEIRDLILEQSRIEDQIKGLYMDLESVRLTSVQMFLRKFL